MCPTRPFTMSGGFVSFSSNFDNLFVQSAAHIGCILKREKPGDLPAGPTIINLRTAKMLGLDSAIAAREGR